MISLLFFSIALFLNAFLLFLVQPLIAKMILPRAGGAPAVWNTCMVFFQVLLLFGYYYAHQVTRKLKLNFQIILHSTLLLLVVFFIPVAIPASWEPDGRHPVLSLFKVLILRLGVPFFVVSATAPLLQKWFALTRHRLAKDPYFLYAASNAGSFGALLAYPLWFESRFHLAGQSRIWSAGYFAAASFIFACALIVWKQKKEETETISSDGGSERVPFPRIFRWVLLGFVPSSLFLGVTTYLATDIAAVPLLWVIPLAIYLLSFLLAFGFPDFLERKFPSWLVSAALLPLSLMIAFNLRNPIWFLALWHLVLLFLMGISCHLQLALDRPDSKHLTGFYLWISLGGALGGIFNAIISPCLFKHTWEYPAAIVLGCALWPGPCGWRSQTRFQWKDAWGFLAGIFFYAGVRLAMSRGLLFDNLMLTRGVILFSAAVVCLFFWRRPIGFAFGIASILTAGYVLSSFISASTMTVKKAQWERSFFGVYQIGVEENASGTYHTFTHGSTIHGVQSLDPARVCEPLSYFHKAGPMGEIFKIFESNPANARVAIVGLGIGSLGGYARPGQQWTFFEIDPLVKRLAENEKDFTYLKRCVPGYEILMGDARLSLARVPDRLYDLIVLDAFSSDSLPVHLATREALRLYLSKLSDHGLLVFNISNRYLDLRPLFSALARAEQLTGYEKTDTVLTRSQVEEGKAGSEWVVMARRPEDLPDLAENRWVPLTEIPPLAKPWTDDYSNVFKLIKFSPLSRK